LRLKDKAGNRPARQTHHEDALAAQRIGQAAADQRRRQARRLRRGDDSSDGKGRKMQQFLQINREERPLRQNPGATDQLHDQQRRYAAQIGLRPPQPLYSLCCQNCLVSCIKWRPVTLCCLPCPPQEPSRKCFIL
jgi:hypothetical protein